MIPASIERHRQRVSAYLKTREKIVWRITEPCRIDNGGILPLPREVGDSAGRQAVEPIFSDIAAFIPAAGAASRFVLPALELLQAMQRPSAPEDLADRIEAFRSRYADTPLPPLLRSLLSCQGSGGSDRLAKLEREIHKPKALYPCDAEGRTFLEYKVREHDAIGGFAGQAFIAPQGLKQQFEGILAAGNPRSPCQVLEQDELLCTYRFDADANLITDAQGRPALVAAGHGMLSRLFPRLKSIFPGTGSLFIRNIDNLAGVSAGVLAETRDFLKTYRLLLSSMQRLRLGLKREDLEAAADAASAMVDLIGIGASPFFTPPPARGKAVELLLWLQKTVFHTPDDLCPASASQATVPMLTRLFQRPFSMVGQAPNSGQDRGGIPVWAERGGLTRKLCLEGPHITEADIKTWFESKQAVSHFNPVFLVTEIPEEEDYYLDRAEDLWLVAEKTFLGRPAYYHETVLYEMIANSALANTVFFEISRALFQPVKALDDFRKIGR